MSRIPHDVERLMWLVAESRDPAATRDFTARFPEFAKELERRKEMVEHLKGARSSSPTPRIPEFSPRASSPEPISRSVWIASGLALATLAVASYSATLWITRPKVEPTPTQPEIVREPAVQPNTTVVTPPRSLESPPQTPPSDPVAVGTPPSQEPPRTLKLSNISLEAALKMIGEAAGFRVEIAPGFKDQQVSIDYVDYKTADMLRDLGLRYGFTPFDQGDGTIIIVPAVDSGVGTGSDEPSRRIGG